MYYGLDSRVANSRFNFTLHFTMCHPERRTPVESQLFFTQNCRGAKTADRITMLIDGFKGQGGFAAFAQETWRAGEERLVQDGCCFLGLGPDKRRQAVARSAWASSSVRLPMTRGSAQVRRCTWTSGSA